MTNVSHKKETRNFTARSIKVLLVDDEQDFLELTKIYLKKISNGRITVDYTTSPESVTSKIAENDYDVIVSDYQMPGMDGLRLFSALLALELDIPFIIFTGRSREEIAINALNLGVDYYIKKGGDPESQFSELEHVINRVVSHKRMEKRLEESEEESWKSREMLDLVTKNLPQYIFLRDLKGAYIWCNEAFAQVAGSVEPDDVIGKTDRELIYSDEESNAFLEVDRQVLETAKPVFSIVNKKTLDGAVEWFETIKVPVFNKEGKVTGILGTSENITERKLAEEELMKSREMLQSVMNNIPVHILWRDKNSIYLGCNEKFARYVGLERPENIVGLTDHDLGYSEEDIRLYRESDIQVIELNTPKFNTVVSSVQKNGRMGWFNRNKIPLHNAEGKVIGVLITIEDITGRKELEEALKKEKGEMELLLDIVTHDLKNYSQINLGYLDLILEMEIPSEIRQLLVKMEQNSTRENDLRNKITVLMKQKLLRDYPLQPVLLQKAVNEAGRSLKELFPNRNIYLETVGITPEFAVLADPLLNELLLNILSNAVKNDDHDTVELLIKLEPGDDGACKLSIIDHGCGIPPDRQKGIFDRYKEFRRTGKGSGLGLYIVKTIIDRYKGKIWIESRLQEDYTKGTKICIELRKNA
ncbi:MAG: PAS domain-containing protein [Candidatus Odinarchaeota archaeon]